jgi:hypothetical protein
MSDQPSHLVQILLPKATGGGEPATAFRWAHDLMGGSRPSARSPRDEVVTVGARASK